MEGSAVVLTLNRPQKRNAINEQVLLGMAQTLDLMRGDRNLRVLVLTGAGGNFCAGADLTQWGDATTPASRLQNHRVWEVFDELEKFDRPVIAAISGYALGGGCELAMCCDLRIASEDAQFGQPEIKVGIIPGGGATHRLTRLVGLSKAKEMIMLGERIPAQEALRIGLVNRVVATDQLHAGGHGLGREAGRSCHRSPSALAKQVMNQTLAVDTGDGPVHGAAGVRRALFHGGPEGRHARLWRESGGRNSGGGRPAMSEWWTISGGAIYTVDDQDTFIRTAPSSSATAPSPR